MKPLSEVESALSELCKLVQEFGQRGWVPATSSNFSWRLDETSMAVTQSGVDKTKLMPKDFMAIDFNFEQKEPDFAKPSAETHIHSCLYKNTDAQVILHTHSVTATVLSRKYEAQKAITFSGYEITKAFQPIATHENDFKLGILPNSQDMVTFAETLAQHLSDPAFRYGFLMAGHGIYTWGKSLAEAKRHLEALEFLLECHLLESRL